MNIEIKSRSLNNYLTYKLDKLEEIYTEEELATVDELVIDSDENLDITVLKYFKNLKELEIRNLMISNDTLDIILSLNNLKDLKFQLCDIENVDRLKGLNLKGLHLDCCEMEDFSFVYEMINLESLTLTGEVNIEINKLNNLINLKYLNISHTICTNDVLNIEKLEELYIDNSNINDISFALNLNNLKVLSLSKEQYENKKELINELKSRNIEILDYSIMLLGDM